MVEKWPRKPSMCAQAASRRSLELGELAEPQAFGDETAGVVADGQFGEPVGRGEAAVEGAGAFGGLGGVLGDVARDLGIGQLPGGGDRPDVVLRPQARVAGRQSRAAGVDADSAGGLVDGGGQQGDGGPGGRGGGGPGRAVEADDGVEVDHAAALVFGDLGEGDPDLRGERLVGQPGLAGEGAAQGDGEAAPQFGGVGVEQDCAGVVVAVRAQRLAEPVVIPACFSPQDMRMPCGQDRRAGGGGSARTRPSFSRRAWTGPKDGAVRVTNTHGWSATVAGMPLPPISPARMSW